MELEALKYVGVGLSSFAMLGAALGVGNIFAALLHGMSRNPAASGEMMRGALIGAALAEAMGLFAFLISLLLIFAI
jgi:F-type H+-transporting ATPase subunit c|tara:strand:- start:2068 stop:2295 length:228 start_codon:yes stop_codon:yes gene_type:complete